MATEFRDPFTVRYRRSIALATPVVAVILSVLFYYVTMPRSAQTASASGDQISESQLLQVGALPVT
jgi:hypothetical protein